MSIVIDRDDKGRFLTGHTFTEEIKTKMSLALKGRISPMKGKHHSEETKRKMSGRPISEETRKKLSESTKRYSLEHPEHLKVLTEKARIANLGRKRPDVSERFKLDPPSKKDEVRKKISESKKGKCSEKLMLQIQRLANARRGKSSPATSIALKEYYKTHPHPLKGLVQSQEVRKKLSELKHQFYLKHPEARIKSKEHGKHLGVAVKRYFVQHPEVKEKISERMKGNQTWLGRHHTKEVRKRIALAMKGNQFGKGKHKSNETKKKISEAIRQLYLNEEYARRRIKGMLLKPNKPERKLLSILYDLSLTDWKYVGDGQLVISGKCPDFWNGDHRLLELYGDYFHRGQNPQDRIDFFKQRGYDCCVLWENELQRENLAALREKLLNFANGGI